MTIRIATCQVPKGAPPTQHFVRKQPWVKGTIRFTPFRKKICKVEKRRDNILTFPPPSFFPIHTYVLTHFLKYFLILLVECLAHLICAVKIAIRQIHINLYREC